MVAIFSGLFEIFSVFYFRNNAINEIVVKFSESSVKIYHQIYCAGP